MLYKIKRVGYLGADPFLSCTANSGTPAATVRIAPTRRYTTAHGNPRQKTARFSLGLYRETTVNLCRSVIVDDVFVQAVESSQLENQPW